MKKILLAGYGNVADASKVRMQYEEDVNYLQVLLARQSLLEARLQRTTRVEEQHLLLAILHDQTETGAKQVLEMNYQDIYFCKQVPAMVSLSNSERKNKKRGISKCYLQFVV